MGEAGMGNFLVRKKARNDSGDESAIGQARIRQNAHQPDIAATVNEFDAAITEQASDRPRHLRMDGQYAGVRSAKHTDASNHRSIVKLNIRDRSPRKVHGRGVPPSVSCTSLFMKEF